MALLTVENLITNFNTEQGCVQAVRDISLHVDQGETLGIVGESGSGKSVAMYSLMGLLPDTASVKASHIRFDEQELAVNTFTSHKAYEKRMQAIRGKDISMIFQDPMSFLNPVMNIETQLIEPMVNHTKMTRAQLHQRALALLEQVGVTAPERRLRQYPHEFSGGMRQRIIIAIALAMQPKLVIADEPTTALDVTIQAKILKLIDELKRESGASVILITHDLGVVAGNCTRIAVMYGGKIVETGLSDEIFYNPKHPYTEGLLRCVNNPESDAPLMPIPGSPPDLLNPPEGCPFVHRCDHAMRICMAYEPDIMGFTPTHSAACWRNYHA